MSDIAAQPSTQRGRLAAVVATVAVALVVVAVLGGGAPAGHEVRVVVPEAVSIIRGQEVRAAGQKIGEIADVSPVENGRASEVRLRITDERAWPLRRGTHVTFRWGGTASYSNRYVDVRPAAGGPPLASGAIIAARDVTWPVEFDQFTGQFTARTRHDLKSMIDTLGVNALTTSPALGDAVPAARPAVAEAGILARDLDDDGRTLVELVRSTAKVTTAVQSADPGLGDIVTSGAQTFDTVGAHAARLRDSLAAVPGVLVQARGTLGRADGTLDAAGRLLDRLGPGVGQLRRVASPLSQTLRTVVAVGPDLTRTLTTARKAAPRVTQLVKTATDQMPALQDIGSKGTEALECIRPYTPEIAAFASTWGDFTSANDKKDRYLRVELEATPISAAALPFDSATALGLFPSLTYAFPAPPGYFAGQPWFLPGCSADKSALDPGADPEAVAVPSQWKGANAAVARARRTP